MLAGTAASGALRRAYAFRSLPTRHFSASHPISFVPRNQRKTDPLWSLTMESSRPIPTSKRQRISLEVAGVNPRHEAGRTFNVPGLVVREHTFTVPLAYSGQAGPFKGQTITLFARELMAPARNENLPFLVYIQGGPGFEAPRPCEASMWIKSAVNSHRVVLLDQRGTGRSSPITTANLAKRGGAGEQAEYLALFRADSIVRDCEVVRQLLVPASSFGGKWAVLGQSFGGFCAVTYLSHAPDALMEVLITGGLPPDITQPCPAEKVYQALHKRMLAANAKYYERFPSDVELVGRIVRYLAAQPGGGPLMCSGSRLTPRLFQTLGLTGMGTGGSFERLHFLLDSFFDSEGEMTPAFAKSFESWHSWDSNPLYALLHEPIYCQGPSSAARWAADRVRDSEPFAAAFHAEAAAAENRPIMFTGECVYRFMYDDIAALRPYKATADLLAEKCDWSQLYDPTTLATNRVPSAAVSYVEDVYVDFNMAMETAAAIKGLKVWITNEYRHSGIRDDGVRIFDRLLGMARNAVFD